MQPERCCGVSLELQGLNYAAALFHALGAALLAGGEITGAALLEVGVDCGCRDASALLRNAGCSAAFLQDVGFGRLGVARDF